MLLNHGVITATTDRRLTNYRLTKLFVNCERIYAFRVKVHNCLLRFTDDLASLYITHTLLYCKCCVSTTFFLRYIITGNCFTQLNWFDSIFLSRIHKTWYLMDKVSLNCQLSFVTLKCAEDSSVKSHI